MRWVYALENYSFLAIAYGRYQLWLALIGFLLLLAVTRCCYRFSAQVLFRTWLVLWCWLLLPLVVMALPRLPFPQGSDLWVDVADMVPDVVSDPCSIQFYDRFSGPVSGFIPWLTWNQLVVLLWAAITLCLVVRWCIQRNRLRRLVSDMHPVTDPVPLALLQRWRERFEIRRPVRLYRSDRCSHPFTYGVWRPTVHVPDFLLTDLDRNDLEAVLGHELAHVKRLDALWLSVQVLVQAVFFFNPLVWMTHRRIAVLRESCCDKLAIQRGDLSARDYSRVLIRVLELRKQAAVGPALFFGGTTSALKQRIQLLLAPPASENPLPLLFATAGLAVASVIVLALANGAAPPMIEPALPARVLVDPLPGARQIAGFEPIEDNHCVIPRGFDRRNGHEGIDLVPTGNHRVTAVADGEVVEVSKLPRWGSLLRIAHDQYLVSTYVHVGNVQVTKGERVYMGQTIARVLKAPAHLHFELRRHGEPLDPEGWLRRH